MSQVSEAMKQKYGRVAVVYGGTSAEREISLKSGAAVLAALKAAGVDAVGVDVSDNPVADIQSANPDRVVLMLHGPGGEDGTIQGALETMGVPYTGSGVLASALAMDKMRCKQLWSGIGLPTAEFVLLTGDCDWSQVMQQLGGDAMVKPASEGSSIGMQRVTSAGELADAWQAASRYGSVIAERWLTGDEYTVAVIDGKALPPIKLETDNNFYDFEAKYVQGDTRYLIPCGLEGDALEQLQNLAVWAYNSLGCEGCARVDVMREGNGDFQVLEVNTLPGMTDSSLVPKSAAAMGISFQDLVLKINDTAKVSTC